MVGIGVGKMRDGKDEVEQHGIMKNTMKLNRIVQWDHEEYNEVKEDGMDSKTNTMRLNSMGCSLSCCPPCM
eukprot:11193820-Lingulodinium_polyedra.AAC.1